MSNLRHIQIPKVNDSKTFEYICKEITETRGEYEQVQFNGRPGQPQDGVDVFARKNGTKDWIGIQCKVRSNNDLSNKEILDEIEKAKDFNPDLEFYHIYTTASRDVKLQEFIRTKYDKILEDYGFKIQIVFWEDIEDILKEEKYYLVYHRYYKKFFANNETLGHGIGKIINLDLGIGDSADTHYELMIGKIPDEESRDYNNANYYKGCFFLINFHERKMETFPLPCSSSDLEQCFSNKFDRFRITEWINSIENINDFIYNNDSDIKTYISKEKYEKFLKELNDE